MWPAIIPAAMKMFGAGAEQIGKYQDRKAAIEEAKHEASLERIRQQESSWKDEYLIIIWTAPIIGAFIPPLQDRVFEGFEFIAALPNWYHVGFVGISFAVFGVNNLGKLPKLRK